MNKKVVNEYNLPRPDQALLDLLNQGEGLTVSNEEHWQLVGGSGYIESRFYTYDGHYESLGVWDNTLSGLESAIEDIRSTLEELDKEE